MIPVKPTPALPWHLLAVFALGIGAGAWSIQEPALGDDFGYWALAAGLHGAGGSSWDLGFHALRWPVWGMSWLLQFLVGHGPASYYGVPLVYLGLGGVLAFIVSRLAFGTEAAGWCAALLLIFHPILDPSIRRPMPDLSEGVWSAAAVLAWLSMMRAGNTPARVAFAALTGLAIATGYANRITGSFIVVALLLGTLVCYRKKFGWLLLAGAFTIGFMVLEGLVYLSLTGDFLHSLHANLSARGSKGTEAVSLWELPLRFLDTLWDGNILKAILNLLALAGMVIFSIAGTALQRALVLWAFAIYLCYSCGVQSFDPLRPMVRDGDRFISAIAFPLAILAAGSLVFLARKSASIIRGRSIQHLARPGVFAGSVIIVLGVITLQALSVRPEFSLGFMGPMRAFLKEVPAGAVVSSHAHMRDLAFFVDPGSQERLVWKIPPDLLHAHPGTAGILSESEYVFYNRKSLWTGTRKSLERKELTSQAPLSEAFGDPVQGWRALAVVAKDHTPDLNFLRRRQPGDPAPDPVPPASVLPGLQLPAEWSGLGRSSHDVAVIDLKPEWRGRVMRLEAVAAANTVEAVSFRLSFSEGTKYVLKPYLYPNPGREVFNFTIPPSAQTLEIRVSLGKLAEWIRLEKLSLTLDGPASVHATAFENDEASGRD